MEKGSMRLEPNISVKLVGAKDLPNYKVEVKNINSFNFVKRAIDYEVKRHIELLEKGETPPQETRGFNENKMATVSQRTKENAQDYRYFPEPDIPPMEFSKEFLKEVEEKLPELPAQKVKRYETEYGIKYQDAFILTRDKTMNDYFENAAKIAKEKEVIQKIATSLINKRIDNKMEPTAFVEAVKQASKPKETNTALLDEVSTKVISANQKVVEDYKNGKQNAIMFLVGQVMREMKGQADAQTVRQELEKKLSHST
jgi:aspartyl-tRNA(Asn)/glutamyl-tRNA(Gln) amidotransferase subunit B